MLKASPVSALKQLHQSVWLDFLRRGLISSGELARLVDEDCVVGVTSNPAIFEKAISGSDDYAEQISELVDEDPTLSPKAVFERLAVSDIREAADVLRHVYEKTQLRDGYVSLEVSPGVAHDTEATLKEARHLWRAIDRPNVMIKVPGTPEGIVAFRELIAEGINVNVTLLFSRKVYEQVAEAYLAGLEDRAAEGEALHHVASVASFFVSRIDLAVDAQLAERLKIATGAQKERLEALRGRVAIANARLAWHSYKQQVASPRWAALAARGAQSQRVLWASTGTKNPSYPDVMYVEGLAGADTVNTMPMETLLAFRHHGQPRESLEAGRPEAIATLQLLEKVGISLDEVTDMLLIDGLKKFSEPFDRQLASIARCFREANEARLDPQAYALPTGLMTDLGAKLKDWDAQGGTRRLWSGDATLWTGSDEGAWLGWLRVIEAGLSGLAPLHALQQEAKSFKHVVLLGMGGSSLGAQLLRETFGRQPGFPELVVLDSTDPAQVRAVEKKLDLKLCLFIVASKSGATLEPELFEAYFFERVKRAVGPAEAGKRFIAITDPGSALDQRAQARGFRHIFHGQPSVGGRYSVLSPFGLVPAAALGLDVEKLLVAARRMLAACGPEVPADHNPGLVLGSILGIAATRGIDKLTFAASPGMIELGAWLEQLIAESTGKDGRGIVPIDRERLGPNGIYGDDRLFVYFRLISEPDTVQEEAVVALEQAGRPVVRIEVGSTADLGQELVRWQFATAVASAVLRVHPFNQPDVEAAKLATRTLTAEYERTGRLPAEQAFFEDEGLALFADEKNIEALKRDVLDEPSLAAFLEAHLARLGTGDYFALLAWVPPTETHDDELQFARHLVREQRGVATSLQYGPRFLHSTGQIHKGGPNSVVVLQVTCDDAKDVEIPGQKVTFGIVKAAQARGDLQVLCDRKRRVLRVHLGPDVSAGLAKLNAALARALT